MTLHDAIVVACIATCVTILADMAVFLVGYLRAHRPMRPPLPDVFLPPGWERWYPDGQGNLRLYRWHNHGWREIPCRRIKLTDEPADS